LVMYIIRLRSVSYIDYYCPMKSVLFFLK
jgi:hypothetical protein